MANGFRRMPIKAEVSAGDREVGGDSQFLSWAQAEQGAVVADAEAQAGCGGGGPGANLAKDRQFAWLG